MGSKEEQIAKELHTPVRHKFPRGKVIVHHIDEIWACDLMDFSKMKLEDPISVHCVRYNYVLVIVDSFGKYSWCLVIKHKTPEEIITCYIQVFKDRGSGADKCKLAYPRKLQYVWWDQERAIG